jgi:reverse transcriptase-like protein
LPSFYIEAGVSSLNSNWHRSFDKVYGNFPTIYRRRLRFIILFLCLCLLLLPHSVHRTIKNFCIVSVLFVTTALGADQGIAILTEGRRPASALISEICVFAGLAIWFRPIVTWTAKGVFGGERHGNDVDSFANALPVELGIRLALDSVAYSNPLPYWHEAVGINCSRRAESIRRGVTEYLHGARPKTAFSVEVPKKKGTKKIWSVPTVNDQIILQTCVSAVAERVYRKSIDRQRVFSYRYNVDPNRLALIEDPISTWNDFQNETHRRCVSNQCLLQFDLAEAFASISRPRFVEFLERAGSSKRVADLLSAFLDSFSPRPEGLPLINDSMFFLGNVYLNEVDKVVGAYTSNFIRFVDDYRVFGRSREELARLLENVERRLLALGYKINSDKVKLGMGHEYLDVVTHIRYEAKTGLPRTALQGGKYINAAIFADIVEPGEMVGLVEKTLQDPDEYLNEGMGRLLLGALKRMRVNALIAVTRNYPRSPQENFSEQLSSNTGLVRRLAELLKIFSEDSKETWRSVWLLYLSQDIDMSQIRDVSTARLLNSTVHHIRKAENVPPIVKFWAARPSEKEIEEQALEQLHDSEYLECGRLVSELRPPQ